MSLVFVALDYFGDNPEAMTILRRSFDQVIIAANRENAFAELKAYQDRCRALIIGVKERITDEFLDNVSKLKAIGTLSVGVDHIDVQSIQKRKIELISARGINAHAVAEHALMAILCLLKETFIAHDSVLRGLDRQGLSRFPRELKGSRIGILGAGNSASALVRCLKPFQCGIRVWTRNRSRHKDLFTEGVQYQDIDELFAANEIITVHLPLTKETAGIVNSRRLVRMPPNGILINVARKELLNRDDLQYVLEKRPDIRFAIDDFGLSDLPYMKTLAGRSILTPHIAGATQESLAAMQVHIAKSIACLA